LGASQRSDKLRHRIAYSSDDPEVGEVEDEGVRVPVDSQDSSGGAHARDVLMCT
jgi:hypothetical protein